MLKIFAAATLAASLALGAIGASDTASPGHTDVSRAAKGDRLPLPQTKSGCRRVLGRTTKPVVSTEQAAGDSAGTGSPGTGRKSRSPAEHHSRVSHNQMSFRRQTSHLFVKR